MVSLQQWLPVVYVVAGLLPLVLLRVALPQREKPGSTGFVVMIVGVGLWSLSDAALIVTTDRGVAAGAFAVRFLGTYLGAVGFFVTFAEYAGLLTSRRRTVVATLSLGAVFVGLALTNHFHALVYGPGVTITNTEIPVPRMGPVFHAEVVVSYLSLVAGLGLGAGEVVRSRGIRRKQSLALLVATLPAIALNALSLFVLDVGFDLTPFGFVWAVFGFGWALFSEDFLEVAPVGRQQAVASIGDPVVVVDDEGRVLDCNAAARTLVDIHDDWEGMPAAAFFGPFPEQVERFADADSVDTEISVTHGGVRRHFDLDISPIQGPQGDTRGRLVLLREITALKERERELDLMRQVQSRVLRHNIRNNLQTVTVNTELLADRLDGENARLASGARREADELLAISDKARAVERLVDEDQIPTAIDVADTVAAVVEDYREVYPEVTFTVESPAECIVETIPALELAVENLVENAAEHNDAADPTVTVTVTDGDTETRVTIRDNGPGIPAHELSVLEQGGETPLEHGSGIGLWIVDWVIEQTTATVDYESDHDGTTVTIRIPG